MVWSWTILRPACSRRLLTQLRLFSNTCGAMMAEPTDSTTPPSSPSTARPNRREIQGRGAANRRAVEHRVIGDDVVADAGMDGERDVVPEGLRQERGFLPRMLHFDPPGREPVGEHGVQQFGPGRRQRVRRLVAQRLLQRLGRGQGHAVLADEAAEAAAIAFAAQRAGQQRQMDAAAGFVPGAEGAGGDILPDAFLGAAEEGEFPIVNGAGAVGGEVGDPAVLDEPVDDAHARRS